MKTKNSRSFFSKGIICAVITACFALSIQAKPLATSLKTDTGKMASKMSKKKMAKKPSDKKMSKMSKMSKDSSKM